MSRCCCKPAYSFHAKFYHVGKDAPELKPGQKVDWSYDPAESGTPFMTYERDGCDCCCTGECPKPCIGCFACGEKCRDGGTLYAGDRTGKPGSGDRDTAKLLGEVVQPPGGGGFKPVMQMMERADPDDPKAETTLFAAVKGPCCTGGLAAMCTESIFAMGAVSPDMTNDSSKLHSANFGDFATITKLKPAGLGQGVRELFTDSDLFDVKFTAKDITPQQKANVLAQMIQLDYMFFERDNDVCNRTDDGGTYISCCNCFVYGCVCPCGIKLGGKNE